MVLNVDIWAYKFFVEFLRADWLTSIFKAITILGNANILILISLIVIIFVKNKKTAMYIAINLLIIASLNLLIKNIVQRPRPEGFRLIEETGYSFPSGHAMISFAFYGLIAYFIFTNTKNKALRTFLCALLLLLIVLIGVSRIYLGVHYASDVMAGYIISFIYLVIAINLTKKSIIKRRKMKKH